MNVLNKGREQRLSNAVAICVVVVANVPAAERLAVFHDDGTW